MTEASYAILLEYATGTRPRGRWDKAGRWWPDRDEERDCCRAIRRPTARWPYTLLRHCRTYRHISHVLGVPEEEVRAALQEARVVAELGR